MAFNLTISNYNRVGDSFYYSTALHLNNQISIIKSVPYLRHGYKLYKLYKLNHIITAIYIESIG